MANFFYAVLFMLVAVAALSSAFEEKQRDSYGIKKFPKPPQLQVAPAMLEHEIPSAKTCSFCIEAVTALQAAIHEGGEDDISLPSLASSVCASRYAVLSPEWSLCESIANDEFPRLSRPLSSASSTPQSICGTIAMC